MEEKGPQRMDVKLKWYGRTGTLNTAPGSEPRQARVLAPVANTLGLSVVW